MDKQEGFKETPIIFLTAFAGGGQIDTRDHIGKLQKTFYKKSLSDGIVKNKNEKSESQLLGKLKKSLPDGRKFKETKNKMPEPPKSNKAISDLASEYSLGPQTLKNVAASIAEGNNPNIDLRVTTRKKVTQSQIDKLEDAGYKVTGSFGKMVNISAPATSLLSPTKGLQNFDWIRTAELRPEMIHN